MRRLVLRALILAAALVALAVPVFRVTGTPGFSAIPTASACSVSGCVLTNTTSTTFNTFFSPITVSVSSNVEVQLHGELTSGATIPGTLTIAVNDLRGNNEGFEVSLESNGFTCTVANLGNFCSGTAVAASDIAVTSVAASTASCIGFCAAITADSTAVGSTLDSLVEVATQCPAELVGLGLYDINVGWTATLSAAEAEALSFFPASYDASWTVTVDESTDELADDCP